MNGGRISFISLNELLEPIPWIQHVIVCRNEWRIQFALAINVRVIFGMRTKVFRKMNFQTP